LDDITGSRKEGEVSLLVAIFCGGYSVARSSCIGRVGTRGRFRMKMVSIAMACLAPLLVGFGLSRSLWGLFVIWVLIGWFSGLLFCHGKRRLHVTKEYTAWYVGLFLGYFLNGFLYDPFENRSSWSLRPALLVCLVAIGMLALSLFFLLQPKTFTAMEGLFESGFHQLTHCGNKEKRGFSNLDSDYGDSPIQLDQEKPQMSSVRCPSFGNLPTTVTPDMPLPVSDELSERFIRGCDGDMEEANRRWKITLEWRKENKVDDILKEPQPHFFLIKEYYPHFMYKRGRNGCPVYFEQVGKANLAAMREKGVGMEQFLRHYIFISEFLYRVANPDDNGQTITVMDVDGIGFKDFSGDTREVFGAAAKIIQDHYVERSNKVFIVNAPSWFNMLWRIIKPMLHPNTQRKVSISARDYREMHEYVGKENLPVYYGGDCTEGFFESNLEKPMHDHVRKISNIKAPDTSHSEKKVAKKSSNSSILSVRSVQDVDLERNSTASLEEKGSEKSKPPKHPTPAPVDTKSESSAGEKKGLIGYVRSAWFSDAKDPPVAHLGSEEGKFYYDSERREWVMEGDTQNSAKDDEDEKVVKAIQAAQYISYCNTHKSEAEHGEFRNASKFTSSWKSKKFGLNASIIRGSLDGKSDSSVQVAVPAMVRILTLWGGILLSVREIFPVFLWLSSRKGGLELSPSEASFLMCIASGVVVISSKPSYEKIEGIVKTSIQSYLLSSFFSSFPIFFMLSSLPWLRQNPKANCYTVVAVIVSMFLVHFHHIRSWVALDYINRIEHHMKLDSFINPKKLAQLISRVIGPFIFAITVCSNSVYPINGCFWFFSCGCAAAFYSVFLHLGHDTEGEQTAQHDQPISTHPDQPAQLTAVSPGIRDTCVL